MPKGFSEREKTLIRAQLLAKGRELLPPSVTHDEPTTPDTTNGSTDPTKGA